MTQKQFHAITESIVNGIVLRDTADKGDEYVPTPADYDQARMLAGMTLNAHREKLVAAAPVIGPI
jgi:hypothetical protein